MVTNSMKKSTEHVKGTTPGNTKVAPKSAARTSANKFFTNKPMAAPIKVPVPAAAKKTMARPAQTTGARAKGIKKNAVTPEERYHMIATAAYFRAEQRGFEGGYEMEDWISGEAEIDARLNA